MARQGGGSKACVVDGAEDESRNRNDGSAVVSIHFGERHVKSIGWEDLRLQ